MRLSQQCLSIIFVLAAASPCLADAPTCPEACKQIPDWALLLILALVYLLLLYGVGQVARALSKDEAWSLSKALSESQPVNVTAPAGASGTKAAPVAGAAVNPTGAPTGGAQPVPTGAGASAAVAQPAPCPMVTEFPPSASRLIAFLGMLVIMTLFLGFGSVMIWEYGKTGKINEPQEAVNFLLVGLSLFAPYAVNQVSGALKAFGK